MPSTLPDSYHYSTNRLYTQFALLSLIVTACLGSLLRGYAVIDIPFLDYKYLLHAHSHIAFLGWAFIGLMALIIHNFFDDESANQASLRSFLYAMFLVLPAMMISFLFQGYGFWSILISTIHMIFSIWFALVFFKATKEMWSTSVRLVRWALIFMMVSSIGPLVLGPLSVLGYKHTMWYNLSIYFYLHFQYNGWFTVAILGLIIKALDGIQPEGYRSDLMALRLTVIGVFLAFIHSAIGYNITILFTSASIIGYLIQISGILLFIYPRIGVMQSFISKKRQWTAQLLLWLLFLTFALKYILPILSTIEPLRNVVFNNRNLVIAFLHMVLLGFVSGYLIWSLVVKNTRNFLVAIGIVLYVIAFSFSEISLLLIGFGKLGEFVLYFNQSMWLLSLLLLISAILIYAGFINRRKQAVKS